MKGKKRGSGYFRLPDLFIVVLFLLIAVFSVDMFRHDLMQTIILQNVEPVGTVVIKKNAVQRRTSSRVLWDRLARESPVYIGDLIRVADLSAATLYLDDHSIDIDENTLLRITQAADGEGLQIVLSEGTVSFAAGTQGRSVSLDLNGIQVLTEPGTVLSAGVYEEVSGASETGGFSVQVSEGNAILVDGGRTVREIPAGVAASFGADRAEKQAITAVVTQPLPNAYYVKSTREPLAVNFSWNRVNLAPEERLRLEISPNRNFSRISGTIENLDSRAQAQFDAGLWYWRLMSGGTVLSEGHLTVAEGSGTELQSPAFNSLFRYSGELPIFNFQWEKVPEAISYIIEVSGTHDFSAPQIRRQVPAASMTDSSLGEGDWFWRVKPIFPPVFLGDAVFSTASFFRIEENPVVQPEMPGVSISQWLAAEAPSEELPPELPPEIIPQRLVKAPEPPPPSPPPPSPPPVLPPPPVLLTAPGNLWPARGTNFGLQDLLAQRTIAFSWSAVRGADSYIFTLYQQAETGRLQVARQTVNSGTGYTLTDLRLLDRGDFVWQVEAVSAGRRSEAGESTFVIDFPYSEPLQLEGTGILYGN